MNRKALQFSRFALTLTVILYGGFHVYLLGWEDGRSETAEYYDQAINQLISNQVQAEMPLELAGDTY
ncbi:hypothetical protein [Rubinisphaera margarita]|uniref:hypothetical protein n=1 Tax=Rubinisphaera margarita TaxID=2909586 RepID=UPI001EE8A131|nr:hypothetical protein [Rubinisphaera margarita]MCG6156168.1 hypothetical protein [Rubinisphaera margarita]